MTIPSDTAHPEGEIVDVLKSTRNVLANSMDGDFSLWSSPTFTRPRLAAWAALKGLEAAIKLLSTPPSRPQGEEGQWRPISEAPRDGTSILTISAAGTQSVNWWRKADTSSGGYWAGSPNNRPDFWQPLPAPPALSSQGKPSS